MSTAFAQDHIGPKELTPEMIERIQKYQMPQPHLGAPVIYYQTGVKDRRRAQVGYVLQAGHRNVTLMLPNGQRQDAVRHIEDPKLALNADQRESGAWDFTDEHKRTISDAHAMKARISDLEDRFSALTKRLSDLERVVHNVPRDPRGRKKGQKDKKPRSGSPATGKSAARMWLANRMMETTGAERKEIFRLSYDALFSRAQAEGVVSQNITSEQYLAEFRRQAESKLSAQNE